MDSIQDLCSGEVQIHEHLGPSDLTEVVREEWEEVAVSCHLSAECWGQGECSRARTASSSFSSRFWKWVWILFVFIFVIQEGSKGYPWIMNIFFFLGLDRDWLQLIFLFCWRWHFLAVGSESLRQSRHTSAKWDWPKADTVLWVQPVQIRSFLSRLRTVSWP